MRGHIYHHVMKSFEYRYLYEKGIAVLDPLTEYKLEKTRKETEEKKSKLQKRLTMRIV